MPPAVLYHSGPRSLGQLRRRRAHQERARGNKKGDVAMAEAERGERDERELMARTRLGQLLVTNPEFIEELLPGLDKTGYEELICVGLQPDQSTLYATIDVKQDFGYGGDLCTGPGAREYVRFFADWNGDGDFTDPDEDLGVASIAVHDVPGSKPLTYSSR
jgi:hypothetical protein